MMTEIFRVTYNYAKWKQSPDRRQKLTKCVTPAVRTQTSPHYSSVVSGGYQPCSCAGSAHISFCGDRQRGWHVQSCFTLFPFYTQTTSHCHHSILQMPLGPLKSVASASGPMISLGKHFSKEGTFTPNELRDLNPSKRAYVQSNKIYPDIVCWVEMSTCQPFYRKCFQTDDARFFFFILYRMRCDIWVVLHSDWHSNRPSLIVFYNWQSIFHTVNLPVCVRGRFLTGYHSRSCLVLFFGCNLSYLVTIMNLTGTSDQMCTAASG